MTKYRLIHQNSNIEVPPGRFDIGRSTECYLILDDPSVSRVHATIVHEEGKLWVEDRGSRNGCVLNGRQIKGKNKLGDGDRLAIGHQTIRIVAVERPPDADKTLGLSSCKSCGAWVAVTDDKCPQCGSDGLSATRVKGSRSTVEIDLSDTSHGARETQRPQAMITALVHKAINMGKYVEADKLLENLMENAVRQREGGMKVDEELLQAINAAAITLAEASQSPTNISRLFALHHALGRLIPRETVESLYNKVRKVGYRACPEMSRYLA
ncbi:MAG: FHA domain-containing protein, partial [Deltaproteobacteria bacterium]|nr:FHA domain-containing protein [Deltaproteobacteria bacterium]